MTRYNWFLTSFIVSVAAAAAFMGFYFFQIINFVKETQMGGNAEDPLFFFSHLFSAPVIVSLIILIISSLAYRIIGIITLVNNPKVQGNDRILWVLGFVFFGFITAIIILILNREKKFFTTTSALNSAGIQRL